MRQLGPACPSLRVVVGVRRVRRGGGDRQRRFRYHLSSAAHGGRRGDPWHPRRHLPRSQVRHSCGWSCLLAASPPYADSGARCVALSVRGLYSVLKDWRRWPRRQLLGLVPGGRDRHPSQNHGWVNLGARLRDMDLLVASRIGFMPNTLIVFERFVVGKVESTGILNQKVRGCGRLEAVARLQIVCGCRVHCRVPGCNVFGTVLGPLMGSCGLEM